MVKSSTSGESSFPSAAYTRCLIQTFKLLPSPQLDGLLLALSFPLSMISKDSATKEDLVQALWEWTLSSIGPGVNTLEKTLDRIIVNSLQAAAEFVSLAVDGEKIKDASSEIKASVQYLRQKTGDNSLDSLFFQKENSRLILSGSLDGLQRLRALFSTGELNCLEFCQIKAIHQVDHHTLHARKARLIQALRLRMQFLLTPKGLEREAILEYLERALSLEHLLGDNRSRVLEHIERALDLERALRFVRENAIARERRRTVVIAVTIASALTIAMLVIIASTIPVAITIASATAIAILVATSQMLDRIKDSLEFDHERALDYLERSLELKNTLEHGSRSVRNLLERVLDTERALQPIQQILDLRNADFKGANLRNIDFRNIDLRGADLTGADIRGAIFDSSVGRVELNKQELQLRGAIVQDFST